MIEMAYTDRKNYVEAYANGVFIGYLNKWSDYDLTWSAAGIPTEVVKFMFRNENTLRQVVDCLKAYKNENGYKSLIISTSNHGYASLFSEAVWRSLGFQTEEYGNPELFYLK